MFGKEVQCVYLAGLNRGLPIVPGQPDLAWATQRDLSVWGGGNPQNPPKM